MKENKEQRLMRECELLKKRKRKYLKVLIVFKLRRRVNSK